MLKGLLSHHVNPSTRHTDRELMESHMVSDVILIDEFVFDGVIPNTKIIKAIGIVTDNSERDHVHDQEQRRRGNKEQPAIGKCERPADRKRLVYVFRVTSQRKLNSIISAIEKVTGTKSHFQNEKRVGLRDWELN